MAIEDREQAELKARLARVRRIEIAAQRLVNEQLSGSYHSVFKGRGMSFDEVRPYNPGDEVRLIDWNVSARTGDVFIKQFVEERELTVLLLADASLSMDFGLSSTEYRTRTGTEREDTTKKTLAAQIAAAIALSAQINNDRVGLVVFGPDVRKFIPPAKGRQHALRVIREVLTLQGAGAPTDLNAALGFVGRLIKRRAAIFILSDFEVPDFEAKLRVTTRRHDVHALVVRDPVEEELFPGGVVTLRDMETGALMPVATDRGFLARFREAVATRDASLDQVFRRLRVPSTRFPTNRAYDRLLAGHFARLKGKSL
jgi:uncharacterized protein (DUF58 family)